LDEALLIDYTRKMKIRKQNLDHSCGSVSHRLDFHSCW